MSKSDNIWVTKVREKLTGYSPKYNTSDWDALKMNLPKSKGWLGLPKPISNWLKVIVLASATGVAAFFIVKLVSETDNSDTDRIEISEINNNQKEILTSSDSIELIESTQAEKHKQTTLKSENSSQILEVEKSVNSLQKVQQDKSFSPKQNVNENLNKSEIDKKISVDSTTKSTVEENILDSKLVPDAEQKSIVRDSSDSENALNDKLVTKPLTNQSDKTLSVGIIEKDETAKQINSSGKSNLKQSNIQEANSKLGKDSNSEIKKKRKKNKRKTSTNNYALRNSSQSNKNKSSVKQKSFKNNKVVKPLFVGANTSFNYLNNIHPCKSKINMSGGLVFEKFISEKSSVEIGLQLHIDNHSYTNSIDIPDSTYNTTYVLNPGDTLLTPVENLVINNTKIEKTNTMNMLYLDFPISYNRYFILNKKEKLAISLGVSNKYFLNYSINGSKISINNKFYFAQSGLVRFKYQRKINNNLFLDFEPFAEIPFRKVLDQDLNWNNYGLNIKILFQVNK